MMNHYSSPAGFRIDDLENDDPVVVDEGMETYNIETKVQQMDKYLDEYMNHYVGNHVFVPMGDDFTFANS